MKTATRFILLASAAVLVTSLPVRAQTTVQQNVTVQATLASRASLTLGAATLTIPDADPGSVFTLTAPSLSVSAKARVAPGAAISLTVLAGSDFTGPTTIPAADFTWTASGDAGFIPGTLNTITAQNLASFSGPGAHTGSQVYSLPNSWDYATGSYSMVVTYTLSLP